MNGQSSEKEKAQWLVWQSKELRTPEKVIMNLLVMYADEQCLSWPTPGPLHDMTGYEPGNIIGIMKRLATLNYISRMDDGKWKIEVMQPEAKDEMPKRRMILLEGTHISMPEGSTLPGWDLNGKKIPEHFEKKVKKGGEHT